MTTSQFVARIRKAGGRVWLDELGRLHAEGVSESQIEELRDCHDLVAALLREEIAATRWENSGKDPGWWRYGEQRWSWPSQELRPADEGVFRQWLKERCTADRRCSSAVKFLYWDFCERHGQDLFPKQFLELLDRAGFAVSEGFVAGLVLGSDLYEWNEDTGREKGRKEDDMLPDENPEDCALISNVD